MSTENWIPIGKIESAKINFSRATYRASVASNPLHSPFVSPQIFYKGLRLGSVKPLKTTQISLNSPNLFNSPQILSKFFKFFQMFSEEDRCCSFIFIFLWKSIIIIIFRKAWKSENLGHNNIGQYRFFCLVLIFFICNNKLAQSNQIRLASGL